MKRIGLYLAVGRNAGGMYQYARAVADALSSLSPDNYAITAACVDPIWLEELQATRFHTILLEHGRLGSRIALGMALSGLHGKHCRILSPLMNPIARQLVSARCDLWVFPAQDPIGYQVPVPAISAIHDLMHRYERQFPEVSAWGRYAIRDRYLRNLAHWSIAILVDSAVGKRQVVESYGVDPSKVQPVPYIPPAYLSIRPSRATLPCNCSLPTKYIFYPAHFWRHKNHISLLAAASRLVKELPDLHLVFVGGKKNGFREVVRAIRSKGMSSHVTILGYVTDEQMIELYLRARAMVMPTLFGPTNIPPLEAFALGCPAAVSNIYGMPEQVGDAALLFNPRSVVEIADCLRTLWSDDDVCDALRAKGFARSKQWSKAEFEARLRDIVDHCSAGA